jgi:transposase-like protein
MDGAREDDLGYTVFPKDHWPNISSTNPIERLNGERMTNGCQPLALLA